MAHEYIVVCRQPLPARSGGWNLTAGSVRIAEAPAAEHAAAVKLAGSCAQLVALSCPDASGTVIEAVGMVLARACRGALVHEQGGQVLDDFKDEAPATAADAVERQLRDVSQSEADAARAKQDFDAQQKADPNAVKAANDWSDL